MDTHKKVQALKDKMWKREYFVMFRTVANPARIPTVMLEHYEWMIDLEKRGRVLVSGPVADRAGNQAAGMTVFRAESWEEAENLAAGDPFVSCGAVTFEIKRWQINEGRINVSIDFSDQTFSAS